MANEESKTISFEEKTLECNCEYCKKNSEEYNDHWLEQW